MRLRVAAVGSSTLVILVGVVAVFLRGSDLLDIDFTGGPNAAVYFKQPVATSRVRQLTATTLPDVSVEELQLKDQPAGERYLIRTTMEDQQEVRRRLGDALGPYIVRPTMTVGDLEPMTSAPNRPADTQIGDIDPLAKERNSVPAIETAASAGPVDEQSRTRKSLQTRTFTGGHRATLSFAAPIPLEQLRAAVDQQLTQLGVFDPERQYALIGITPAANADDGFVAITIESALPTEQITTALELVGQDFAAQPVLERLDNFGGQVAGEARLTAGMALLAGMAVIVIYLWIRFQNILFGLGAVIALLHDVLIVLGLVALSRWLAGNIVGNTLLLDAFKIDLPMVAAFLTLVGYSVNDTIVVFDRIRETRKRHEPMSWVQLNHSINQTLSRTLLTSLTTWIVAIILYVWGGQGIHGFAFILTTGIVVGTYSSIYIASPMLIWLAPTSTHGHIKTPSEPDVAAAASSGAATKGAAPGVPS